MEDNGGNKTTYDGKPRMVISVHISRRRLRFVGASKLNYLHLYYPGTISFNSSIFKNLEIMQTHYNI